MWPYNYTNISELELVDSLYRNSADMPVSLNSSELPTTAVLSLFDT